MQEDEASAASLFLAGLWNTSENSGKQKAIYLSDKANAFL